VKSLLTDHSFVFVENASLKQPKTLLHVAAESQIHAGFIILDGVPAAEKLSANGNDQLVSLRTPPRWRPA
jgi:hypothetical protein